jgi:FkbM family methyltransferase
MTQIDIAGVRINTAGIDPAIVEAMRAGRYEDGELRALSRCLREDDVVMELGTGIGLLATFSAQRLGSHRVFTFEANPDLEPRIRETFALNDVSPSLEICMLGERQGEAEFFVHEAFWSSSAVGGKGAVRAIRVPVRPLNEAIARIRPTVLVMDIEGAEAELLRFADLRGVDRLVGEFHERMLGRAAVEAMVGGLYAQGFAIVRDASRWEACCLERTSAPDPARHVSLDEFRLGAWRLGDHWAAGCFDELMELVPPGAAYAMIDDDQWGCLQVLPGRRRVPFVDEDGEYAGAPADDTIALETLRRQRQQGLQLVLFAPWCGWWLQHYSMFAAQLRGGELATSGRALAYRVA